MHPPKRGIYMMGSQPLVHSGFYKAWVARGLDTQVLSFLQVGTLLPHSICRAAHVWS